MTKVKLYVRIICMKVVKLSFKKTILVLTLTMLTLLCLVGTFAVSKVSALTQVQTQRLLPSSSLEYYELNSPIDVYHDDDLTAILQNDQSLIIYKNGQFIKTWLSFTDVKQVKRLNENTLLVSDNGSLYTIDVNTLDKQLFTFTSEEHIGGNYFDLNDQYLITSYSSVVIVYKLQNSKPISKSPISDCNQAPVAVNDTTMFYVKNNTLCSLSLTSSITDTPITIKENIYPDQMIADNDNVVYLKDGKVYKISLLDKYEEELIVAGDSNHDLGNIIAPSNILFKGENLLVVGDNAVQEFAIENNTLQFTGFAIAKNKSAYNRINASVKEVERFGNTLAILDEQKLSIIDTKVSENSLDKTLYTHYFTQTLKEQETLSSPDSFCLGNSNALLLYQSGTVKCSLKSLNVKTGELADVKVSESVFIIRDVCYQSGYYYVLGDEGNNNAMVYRASSLDGEFEFLFSQQTYADTFEVDVFGNVYLFSQTTYLKMVKTDSTYSPVNVSALAGVKKLCTDLGGGLFALTNDSVYYLDINNSWQKILIAMSEQNSMLKSFTLSFDKKEVYFVCENSELVLTTSQLPNISIDTLSVSTDFKITDKNADIETFKAYSPIESANVYSVKVDVANNVFTYNKLISDRQTYAFVCPIKTVDSFGRQFEIWALVGQTDLVLVNPTNLTDVTPEISSTVPENAFVTTGVSAYYYPIITPASDYALSDGIIIRLEKSQNIKPIKQLTLLSNSYYFAEFTYNGQTHTGYVPINFTVEVLAEDLQWNEYRLEKVNATTVYSSIQLEDSIAELEDNSYVRIVKNDNGVCQILFETETGWVKGFIQASAIKNEPYLAIRNIIIIALVMASVCATTAYFVIRKKS